MRKFLIFAAAVGLVGSASSTILSSPVLAKSASSANALPAGAKLKTIKQGQGAPPLATDTILANYQITIKGEDQPINGVWETFPADQTLKGLSSALLKMQKGGRYRVTLTADQAFGEFSPFPHIPIDSVLDINVELLDFRQQQVAPIIGSAARDDQTAEPAVTPDVIKYAVNQPDVVTQPSGLKYKQLAAGEGDRPDKSATVLVGYEGRLLNGKVFDSNVQASFPVAGVVPGFGEALQLMQKGGSYRVWIPPALGYGDRGAGEAVPPGAWLIFDVKLLDFISAEDLKKLQAGAGSRN
ncbi:FKBP-type peptidyl-prolyl cis-trans isomerase [Parasphingorhabdus halotolerans]|uniref:Peptidyl-prolyl cis-trans isomerase n=1 Tax=Parasphingorhabdus halotolerans TaxID=2725558 RepID=A0A6H2DP15_9SPHN|nr:FKBP-type peptidyl-prolyl cis-trans isomerase [Parasphingorhabdus halotolerans]QJB70130.1 hypothetical protein HF685_13225 [Parasphingorhabdus halotolerans]